MMETDEAPILRTKSAPEKKTRFSTWFAIIFILGFGLALLAMTGVQWSKKCDQPMKIYMLMAGVAGVVASIFFLALEVMFMESKDPNDDGSLKGGSMQFFSFICVYFLISGGIGTAWYFSGSSCEDTAYSTYRWTWAAVLLFLILASMMFSDAFGKLGGSVFGKFGNLIGNLFQALADLFKGMASVLTEGPADPENVPPARSAAAVFAIYVNHSAFLWFFLYIFFEAYHERKLACDKPLRTFLYVFGVFGVVLTYSHFVYELFAGVKTRQRLASKQSIAFSIVAVLTIIWGILGFTWVQSAETCNDDGNAVNTYRLSYLLSCCFLVFACLGGLFMCMGILDFLCSGKMRLVVVVATGDEEEEDDVRP